MREPVRTARPALLLAAGAAALTLCAASEKLKTVSYVIRTDKLTAPVRLLHVSDLHSSCFGEGQRDLIALTEALAPDAVLMTGDIADNRIPNTAAFLYAAAVGASFPCFYVSGNHEIYSGRIDALKKRFAA